MQVQVLPEFKSLHCTCTPRCETVDVNMSENADSSPAPVPTPPLSVEFGQPPSPYPSQVATGLPPYPLPPYVNFNGGHHQHQPFPYGYPPANNHHYEGNNGGGPQYHYNFIAGSVTCLDYNDPAALTLIKEQVPVILRGADLVEPAMKWDLAYLNEHIGSGAFAVFIRNASADAIAQSQSQISAFAASRRNLSSSSSSSSSTPPPPSQTYHPEPLHVFKYFDEKKLLGLQDRTSFQSTMVRVEMTFQEFLKRFHGDRSQERVYLQQPLNNTVGPQIAADFVRFNWSWAAEHKKEFNWGPLTSNLLLIGQKGNVTPCHFDEQQNLFCPLRGRKKILLFHPDNFPNLYPYPVHHPNDRQSQVDLDNPDYTKFPKFANARAVEAVVGPGEILYIPMYWWHHVINLDDTIAINFWHKAGGGAPIEYPLQARQKIAMVRNIEKMLLEALQDQSDLKELLHWIVDGRF